MSSCAAQPGPEFRFVLAQAKLLDLTLAAQTWVCGKALQARGGQPASLGKPGAQVGMLPGVLSCCWLGLC